MVPNLKVGDLAYFDGMTGLAKCKVVSINGKSQHPTSAVEVEIELTKDYIGWPKGKILRISSIWVVPRNAVRKRKYGSTIGFYTVNL